MPTHARSGSRIFRGGGGGLKWGGGGLTNKNSDVSVCFLVLNLYIRSPLVKFKGNYHFLRFQVGVQLFSGGGGGVQLLIHIETHITCGFQGGGPDPISLYLIVHIVF